MMDFRIVRDVSPSFAGFRLREIAQSGNPKLKDLVGTAPDLDAPRGKWGVVLNASELPLAEWAQKLKENTARDAARRSWIKEINTFLSARRGRGFWEK